MKASIGKEIGLEHQYSKNIHVGIVKSVTSDEVTITDLRGNDVTLKISNVNILPREEVYSWKKNNLQIHRFDVSVILPETCDTNILVHMFKNIDPVIDVKVKEVYTGEQIEDGYISITFTYTTFNKEDRKVVEKYLEGIGGTIR